MLKIKNVFLFVWFLFLFENGLTDDTCLKIKYILEDKISLNWGTPQKTQDSIKQKDFSKHKSLYNKKYIGNV